ncbi:MAG: response regulator transcription factor [Patescibacteria group bacterium]
MKILLVEDDKDILAFLRASLKTEGFVVDATDDGERGMEMARINSYDLIILDLNLPNKNGDEICRDIRGRGKTTPILMLSVQSSVSNKVDLLNSGADDYVCKPFSFEEVLARIKALLRRPAATYKETLTCADLVMDLNKRIVKRNGREINLTGKEFNLLEYLLRHKGEIVPKTAILENVWDSEVDLFSNAIETHVLNLRKKLNRASSDDLIKTVSGRGYRIG